MTARRVAVTGAAGQLGREVVRAFTDAGDEVLALARPGFDLERQPDVDRIASWRPHVVVNCAAWTDVDGCARDPERAMRINGEAAGNVARAAAAAGALALQVSTNEVFDGSLERPYVESDPPAPINPYGASKLAGERLTAAAAPRHLVVRTAWLFGPSSPSFLTRIRAAAGRARAAGDPLRVVTDERGNPTPTPWLADAIRRLAELEQAGAAAAGIYHLVAEPATSRFEWARRCLGAEHEVVPITLAEYPRPSRVPPRAVLSPARAISLGVGAGDWRPLSDALCRG